MMVAYAPSFVRQYKKLPPALQVEVDEKIAVFSNDATHPSLKAHKLKGRLNNRHSFSVNYAYRIVYAFLTKSEVVLLAVGDHDVYR